jgi:hypothetical protein
MPLLRRPYSGPYDHERRRGWPAALRALAALLAVGLIGWAIGSAAGSGTATRTVTLTAPAGVPGWATPARVVDGIALGWPHTALGAAAAAAAWEHRFGEAEAGLLNGSTLVALTTAAPLAANASGLDRAFGGANHAVDVARSRGALFAHGWTLGYRLASYSVSQATIELWTLAGLVGSVPANEVGAPGQWGLSWPLTLVTVRWEGGDWKITGSRPAGELSPAGTDTSQSTATAFAEQSTSFTVMPSVP